MSTVTEHYQSLLAKHYTWMFGTSFEQKVAEQEALLSQTLRSVKDGRATLAVDLGSGPGFQTIALAQLGFSPVIAIDTSAELLEELRTHAVGLPIQTRLADLRDLSNIVSPGQASVIVCMGDTLTHLPARSDVTALFAAIFNALSPGGTFVLTWRDLTVEARGLDRFIPVRSDENAIMTCFLEYSDADTVTVHDLIYAREGSSWALNKSSYAKLRLSPQWLAQQLAAAGLLVESQGPAGRLLQIVARKP